MLDNFQMVSLFLTTIGAVGTLAWWLSVQLNKIKDLVYIQIKETSIKIDQMERILMEKLEYHERHDDKRFGNIRDSLWEIRLRNAASDGVVSTLNAKKAQIKREDENH